MALLAGCPAHTQKVGSLEGLKSAAEIFHRSLRWNDLRGAAQMIVPERRADFLKKAFEHKDDEDLKVIDYELEDAQLQDKGATVLSKLTWHRLPSVTAKTEVVTSEWVDRAGVWFIESIEGGPEPLPKKEPKAPEPKPDAPKPEAPAAP